MAEKSEKGDVGVPPADAVKEPNNEKKGNGAAKVMARLFLMFYFHAVTGALVVVCVFGPAFFCDECHSMGKNVTHYNFNDSGIQSDVDLDLAQNREVIHRHKGDDLNETLMVFDFDKNIGGLWMDGQQSCFLFDDLENIPKPQDLEHFYQDPESKTESEVDFVVDHNRPVTDYSVVPPELLTKCWGKPMYWIQQGEHRNGVRNKRDVIVVIRCKCGTVYVIIFRD